MLTCGCGASAGVLARAVGLLGLSIVSEEEARKSGGVCGSGDRKDGGTGAINRALRVSKIQLELFDRVSVRYVGTWDGEKRKRERERPLKLARW